MKPLVQARKVLPRVIRQSPPTAVGFKATYKCRQIVTQNGPLKAVPL